jgi:hypothetical protein
MHDALYSGSACGKFGTVGTYPLSEKIVAATQNSQNIIEKRPVCPRSPRFRFKPAPPAGTPKADGLATKVQKEVAFT